MGRKSPSIQPNRPLLEIPHKQANTGTRNSSHAAGPSWQTPSRSAGFSHRCDRSHCCKQPPLTPCVSLPHDPALALQNFSIARLGLLSLQFSCWPGQPPFITSCHPGFFVASNLLKGMRSRNHLQKEITHFLSSELAHRTPVFLAVNSHPSKTPSSSQLVQLTPVSPRCQAAPRPTCPMSKDLPEFLMGCCPTSLPATPTTALLKPMHMHGKQVSFSLGSH